MKCKPIEPYLFQAWYDWMCDSQLTAHIIILDDKNPDLLVPTGYTKKDQTITLNISPQATESFHLNQKAVEFLARFDHGVENIYAPFSNIMGIFASENGQGTLFSPKKDQENPAEHSKNKESKNSHLKII